jgi:hypothetical protein
MNRPCSRCRSELWFVEAFRQQKIIFNVTFKTENDSAMLNFLLLTTSSTASNSPGL